MDPVTSVLLVLAFGLFVLLVLIVTIETLYQSIYLIEADEKIVFYNFGRLSHVVVNSTYMDNQRANINASTAVIREGTYGFAIGWWPFYLGFRVPTTQFEIPIHVGDMYTSTQSLHSRVRIQGDATIQIRLGENFAQLGTMFPLFKLSLATFFRKNLRNLALFTDLVDHGLNVSGGEGATHHHRLRAIAVIMHNTLNKPVLQAMRTASTGFTFSVTDETNVANDIMTHQTQFEQAVKTILVASVDGIFVQAGLLTSTGEAGPSLLSCSLVVEKLQLQAAKEDDSEAIKAIDAVFVGTQKGKADEIQQRLKRVGQAAGIQAIKDTLGLQSSDAAYLYDVLRETGKEVNLNQIGVGESALAALQRALGN